MHSSRPCAFPALVSFRLFLASLASSTALSMYFRFIRNDHVHSRFCHLKSFDSPFQSV